MELLLGEGRPTRHLNIHPCHHHPSQLYQTQVTGGNGKHLHLNVIWPCEILVLKKKIQALCSIRSDNQRLVYMGKILRDEEMIPEECFIKEDKAAQKRHDGTAEMVFHIWLVNIGFR